MNIVQKPHLTAKSAKLNKKNQYTFIVNKKANRSEIKKTVEKQYKVSIERVNTVNYPSKKILKHTQKGLIKGRKAAYKKAILTLKEGSIIDIQAHTV